MSPYYFTIAIRRKREKSYFEEQWFIPDFVIPSNHREWCADPILVEDHGRTYMFYEAVSDSHGRIEVVEIYDDCRTSEPHVILETEHHYSYPFVFRAYNQWYMIPESSSQGEVCLYKAVEFPLKWSKKNVLLSEPLVDTTVFQYEEGWYMLSFNPHKGSEEVEGKAYRVSFGETIRLTPIVWENQNALEIRGAGPFFQHDGVMFRPAQLNKEDQYGNGLVFYEVVASNDRYHETKCRSFSLNRMKMMDYEIDGIHTYCQSSKFEVIDIRCRSFDIAKTPRNIKKRIQSRMT